jgi:hypothetical protein
MLASARREARRRAFCRDGAVTAPNAKRHTRRLRRKRVVRKPLMSLVCKRQRNRRPVVGYTACRPGILSRRGLDKSAQITILLKWLLRSVEHPPKPLSTMTLCSVGRLALSAKYVEPRLVARCQHPMHRAPARPVPCAAAQSCLGADRCWSRRGRREPAAWAQQSLNHPSHLHPRFQQQRCGGCRSH